MAAIALACDQARVQEPEARRTVTASAAALPVVGLSDRLSRPEPPRLVAIGDLHGDLDHTRRALRLAGAIDANGSWTGGPLVVVQTGDEIDRGDDDRAVLDSVERWRTEARGAHGEFIALLGNHELMNAAFDFRYVTPAGFSSFAAFAARDAGTLGTLIEPDQLGRAAAFAPGAPYAVLLASRPIVVKVGDTVFAHGGILPQHVRYGLDKMNDEVDAWLRGQRAAPPDVAVAQSGPVWTREYSSGSAEGACAELDRVLAELGAKRMVVGHTVQASGITSACGGHVWRIDVGLSHVYGGPIEALQIENDRLTVLREP